MFNYQWQYIKRHIESCESVIKPIWYTLNVIHFYNKKVMKINKAIKLPVFTEFYITNAVKIDN